MPTFEKRRGKLCVCVMLDGVGHRKTFHNKADFHLWAKTVETDIAETHADTKHTPATFRHVLREYQALELEGRDNDQILVEGLCQEKWVFKRVWIQCSKEWPLDTGEASSPD